MMKQRLVKPYTHVDLGSLLGIVSIIILIWVLVPLFAYIKYDTSLISYLLSLGFAVFLLLMIRPAILVLNRRQSKQREAAAKGDATNARLIATSSDVPFQLPLVFSVRWKANLIARLLVVMGGVVFLGLAFGTLFGYQLVLLCLLVAMITLVAFFASANRYTTTLTLDEDGIAMRYRWTRTFIPWQEVRLLWMQSPRQSNAADALYPTRGSIYEVASARKRISFTVISKSRTDFEIAEHDTYYERTAAALAAIMQRASIGLWGAK